MSDVDNQQQTDAVDGFSDVAEGDVNVDAADKGIEGHQKPLDPDEYARLQKEARELGDSKEDLHKGQG